ncbi:polysaccharide deacetylase family protein [Chloroflexota bacterium]
MINALCIDFEPWYTPELLRKYIPEAKCWDKEDQAVEAVLPILDLLDKYNTKATFAVLGIVAEAHPEIVKSIFEKGHEIASHAYSHRMLNELGREKFEDEIKMSTKLLESITGQKPIGFRAPSFSINNSTKWAFEVLTKYGFKYDASICPVNARLYGVPKAPLHPYRPSLNDVSQEDISGSIIEFPMTAIKLGVNIPISGGFYFRTLPLWFLKLAIRKVNQTRPALIYIHPWETYPKTPRLKNLPLASRFITYYGIGSALKKFEALLKEFQFQPLREALASDYQLKYHNANMMAIK